LVNSNVEKEILKLQNDNPINSVLKRENRKGIDFDIISGEMWEFLKTHNIAPNCREIKRLYEKPVDGGFNCDLDLDYLDVRLL